MWLLCCVLSRSSLLITSPESRLLVCRFCFSGWPQTGSWASDLPSPSVPHVTCSAMGWFQRPNKIDTHVFCPNLPRESNAFASMCTFRDGTDSRHRKEAILAPRSRYLQSKPRSPWRTWRKRGWRDFFQFIEVYTWKLLKGGTCGLLRL